MLIIIERGRSNPPNAPSSSAKPCRQEPEKSRRCTMDVSQGHKYQFAPIGHRLGDEAMESDFARDLEAIDPTATLLPIQK
jgi:hypothetical protein